MMEILKNNVKIIAILIIIFIAIFMLIPTNKTPEIYQDKTPKLDIREYLNGNLKAWGMLKNRKGEVTRKFVVDMKGTWDNNSGVLEEYFTFDDGEKSQRIWKINFIDNNNFEAVADDVIGKAVGSQYGNAVQMKYVLDLEVDKEKGTKYKVNLDDWMYLVEDDILINESTIKKFGISFAKLTIFFQKIDE